MQAPMSAAHEWNHTARGLGWAGLGLGLAEKGLGVRRGGTRYQLLGMDWSCWLTFFLHPGWKSIGLWRFQGVRRDNSDT
jgi:hypothetical protein